MRFYLKKCSLLLSTPLALARHEAQAGWPRGAAGTVQAPAPQRASCEGGRAVAASRRTRMLRIARLAMDSQKSLKKTSELLR